MHDVSLAAVEADNPQFASDYNLIYAGQQVAIQSGESYSSWTPSPAPAPAASTSYSAPAPVTHPAQVVSASGGSFQSCVIQRESGGDPSAVNAASGAGGLYQFLPSTWSSLGYSGSPQDASVATQNAAFNKLYAEDGTSPWAPSDGC